MHELPTPGPDGYIVFYTNPTCTELCDGPDASCMRQVMHSSFQGFNITGHFEVSDVHGHNTYRDRNAVPEGVDKIHGLTGIAQVEGGLGEMDEDSM